MNRSLLLLAAGSILPWAGCSTLREPHAANVAEARRMALRGVEAMHRGQWAEAEQLFQRSLAGCPQEERAHRNLAEVLWQRGERTAALHHLQVAAELSGGAAEPLVRLGAWQLQAGLLEQAQLSAESALRRERHNAAAHGLLGDVLRQQGRWDAALHSYHRSLSLWPEQLPVELRVARIYLAQGRPRRALSGLDAVAARRADYAGEPELLTLQGLALRDLQRLDDAERRLAEAARRAPTWERLHQLSQLQRQQGKQAAARKTAAAAAALAAGRPPPPATAESAPQTPQDPHKPVRFVGFQAEQSSPF
jgi:Tfp pilus assembly protein PilF